LRLLKGETFLDIINKNLPDRKVNQCREVYFTFNQPSKQDIEKLSNDDDNDDTNDND
jgi:hypothetical protein